MSRVYKKEVRKKLKPIETLDERLQLLNKNMNYNLMKVSDSDDVPHEALIISELLGVNEKIIANVKKTLKKK